MFPVSVECLLLLTALLLIFFFQNSSKFVITLNRDLAHCASSSCSASRDFASEWESGGLPLSLSAAQRSAGMLPNLLRCLQLRCLRRRRLGQAERASERERLERARQRIRPSPNSALSFRFPFNAKQCTAAATTSTTTKAAAAATMPTSRG